MPKQVGDVREAALQETKRLLLDENEKDFSMRTVAGACGIAVGTLYNYFPSKDVMIACVMLEDWMLCIKHMGERLQNIDSLKQGISVVYGEINGFSLIYSRVWNTVQTQTEALTAKRHQMLVAQIEGVLDGLLKRFGGTDNPCLRNAAVELLLQQASRPGSEGPEGIWPAIERLLAV